MGSALPRPVRGGVAGVPGKRADPRRRRPLGEMRQFRKQRRRRRRRRRGFVRRYAYPVSISHSPHYATDFPYKTDIYFYNLRHNSVRSTLSDVSGTDVEGSDDDDETATTVDDYMLPKELSTHWSGFFTEIFVFRDTVMPTLLPQIVVAFFLGVLAQVVKMRACGADVVAAAECQTTFDITGHQVVSVSLGFLLVFRYGPFQKPKPGLQ